MKKIGLNLLIGSILSIVLIVICLLVIKPNYRYLIAYNDKVYVSTDDSTFCYDNNEISFSKQDNKLSIDVKMHNGNTYTEDKIVYLIDTGYTAFAIEDSAKKETFDATITFSDDEERSPSIKSNSKELTYTEMMICYKYSSLINSKLNGIGKQKVNNDRISATSQKIICSILSIFIGFILSFLAYPVILYDKIKETKKLAVFSIGLTLILCLSSAFYIYFTLK